MIFRRMMNLLLRLRTVQKRQALKKTARVTGAGLILMGCADEVQDGKLDIFARGKQHTPAQQMVDTVTTVKTVVELGAEWLMQVLPVAHTRSEQSLLQQVAGKRVPMRSPQDWHSAGHLNGQILSTSLAPSLDRVQLSSYSRPWKERSPTQQYLGVQ